MRSPRSTLVLLALTAWLTAAAQAAEPQSAAATDNQIAAATRLRLLTAPGFDPLAVHIDTRSGRVTLFGNVPSDAQRLEAERLVRQVPGVLEVVNELRVTSADVGQQAPVADAILKQRIEEALAADSLLRSSGVTVGSVIDGVVVLGGTASNIDLHLRAVERARRVPGVIQVTSNVVASDSFNPGIVDPDAKPGSNALEPERRPETDLWLASQVRQRLLSESKVPMAKVLVDAFDGTVTLMGNVPDAVARQTAETAAREVQGVRSVENRLGIDPKTPDEKVGRDSATLLSEVNKAISAVGNSRGVKATITTGDAVTLHGVVQGEADRIAVETAARGVAGVSSVRNEIIVRPSS